MITVAGKTAGQWNDITLASNLVEVFELRRSCDIMIPVDTVLDLTSALLPLLNQSSLAQWTSTLLDLLVGGPHPANVLRRVKDVYAAVGKLPYLAAAIEPRIKEVPNWILLEGVLMPSLKAFIVHGHDRELLFEVKDYLQNTLKWHEPIVLEQRPAKGRTIIEKFEEESDQIDVVFVLLTPDDVGGKKGAEPGERARQNVIFELGYFRLSFWPSERTGHCDQKR